MKKSVGIAAATLFLSGLLATGVYAPGAQAQGPKQQKYLNYVTLPSGTTHYSIAVVQAKTITDKTDIKVMVQPANGPMAIPGLIGSKQADIAIGNSLTVYWAYNGLVDFKEQHRFARALQSGNDLLFGIVTHKGTGIKTIADLKGKRFTYNYPTSAFLKRLAELEMQAYGLSPADVITMKAEFNPKALQDLADKRTDAVMSSVQGSMMQELATRVDTVVLPFARSKIDIVSKEMPPASSEVTPATIPKVPAAIPVVAIPNILWTHKDLDVDTAYQVVKALVENYREMIPALADFGQWTPARAVRFLGIPFHPGAIKYYREKGLWSPEMEKKQEELLAGEK
jgi:TRAP transporter TAXI family solute receptor